MIPPQAALFDPGEAASGLPVCDHYAGVEARMVKSLALQAELGPVFDVTLDCEDGAPVGAEAAHADLVTAMVMSAANVHGRCGVARPSGRAPAFAADVATIVGAAAARLAYVMVPKVDGVADVARAAAAIDAAGGARVPLHALVETHGAPARGRGDRGASADRVDLVRPDGFRLGAPRRHPRVGDDGAGPVRASAGAARQARDRGGLPCLRQDAVALASSPS